MALYVIIKIRKILWLSQQLAGTVRKATLLKNDLKKKRKIPEERDRLQQTLHIDVYSIHHFELVLLKLQ